MSETQDTIESVIPEDLDTQTQLEDGETEQPKRRKEPVPLTYEPGKSVLPFARVQRILKADKELPMVAREATFLISLATEEFIKRIAEASHRNASKEKRTTAQWRDIATVVRKADEFMFLEEIIPWKIAETAGQRKPKALQEKETDNRQATIFDSFVPRSRVTKPDSQQDDVMINEDGTMWVGGENISSDGE